jgi:hypothetical protein
MFIYCMRKVTVYELAFEMGTRRGVEISRRFRKHFLELSDYNVCRNVGEPLFPYPLGCLLIQRVRRQSQFLRTRIVCYRAKYSVEYGAGTVSVLLELPHLLL